MTGIIICDNCNQLFFAHGDITALPDYLKDIAKFVGIRMIKSTEVKFRTIKGLSVPVFKDYCANCAYELNKEKGGLIK